MSYYRPGASYTDQMAQLYELLHRHLPTLRYKGGNAKQRRKLMRLATRLLREQEAVLEPTPAR